jgi:hypothetical protein
MRVPGPFETVATEAFFNLTPPDPAWDDARVRQHMTYFNRPGLLGIAVHEAFPGHFVQLLYQQHLPSDLRKVIQPWTLVEGWAHYTEQMMVDEGLGGSDPRVRLGQLRRALDVTLEPLGARLSHGLQDSLRLSKGVARFLGVLRQLEGSGGDGQRVDRAVDAELKRIEGSHDRLEVDAKADRLLENDE